MMKFLVDTSPARLAELPKELVMGQLITPLTRYKNAGEFFAIDNGAFSGFKIQRFTALLNQQNKHRAKCLFVVAPDIVGNGRRTLELWKHRIEFGIISWPLAFVAQDGIEDLDIPWAQFTTLFLGGLDPWKDSTAAVDIVKTAKTLGKRVHIGRVNTRKRFLKFDKLGADTCDGSGIAKYRHMLPAIAAAVKNEQQQLTLELDQ